MEVSFCEIIRETRNAINSRLDLLDVLVKNKSTVAENSRTAVNFEILNRKYSETAERLSNIESTLYRFNDLISNVIQKIKNMENHTCVSPIKTPPYDEVIPTITIEDSTKSVLTISSHHDDESEDEEYCDECARECDGAHGKSADMKFEVRNDYCTQIQTEQQEEEEKEEKEEKENEEAEEDEESEEEKEEEENEEAEEEENEEAEEAEEGIELEEFEYKGMTLYRDGESKVYSRDEEGALSEPIGIWDEVKQRIKKIL